MDLHKASPQRIRRASKSFQSVCPLSLLWEKRLLGLPKKNFELTLPREYNNSKGSQYYSIHAENKRGTLVRDPAREWVEDIMLAWGLEHINPSKWKYTSSNKRLGSGHIAGHLDRFIVQNSFLDFFLKATSKILPHYVSDHKPIHLDLSLERNLGPIPFLFYLIWIQQEGFQDIVSQAWILHVRGSPFYMMEEKLRILKRSLKI